MAITGNMVSAFRVFLSLRDIWFSLWTAILLRLILHVNAIVVLRGFNKVVASLSCRACHHCTLLWTIALYIKTFVCLYCVVHIHTQLYYNNVSGCTLGFEIARRIIADNFLQKYPIIFIPKSYTLQTSWLGWGCLLWLLLRRRCGLEEVRSVRTTRA